MYVHRDAFDTIIEMDTTHVKKVQKLLAVGLVTDRAFKTIVRQCKLQPMNATDWQTVLQLCISHVAEKRQSVDNKDRCYKILMKAPNSCGVLPRWLDTCSNVDGTLDYDKLLLFASSAVKV